jgi:acetylserotonin N-methyltransferase
MTHEAPAQTILDLIEAFRRSKVMFTAVRLGVFEQLAVSPQTCDALAAQLSLNPLALGRLLNGCVTLGLLEHKGDGYSNTSAAARFLTKASPETLAGYIVYSDQSLYKLWDHLDDAVREGTNRWAQAFGSRASLFDHYFRDETSTRSFLAGMHGFGQLASPRIAKAFDLSRFAHLVDLGGATGHLAFAVCRAYPSLKATVFDLPAVEPFAREYIAQSGLGERVDFVVGDFFADDLPPADLYVLGRILHDWDDPKIEKLLRKVCATLPAHGALLVTETLVDADRSGPTYTLMQDLNMLVCTDGRERTEAEYSALLKGAGFSTVEFSRTDSLVDAILATKN